MSVINQNLLLTPEGYQISRSVRLRSSASAYFNKTPAAAGNRTAWTMSMWVKRGSLGTMGLFSTINSGTVNTTVGFNGDAIDFLEYQSATVARLVTTAVFRDPSAWYHLVFVWDTSNATSTDRVRIYVNGVRMTSFSGPTYPSLNLASIWNNNVSSTIGTYNNGAPPQLYLDGYLTEVNFIDGQALTPSSFGETDAVTGVWKPKKYAGTYGTNGFYLNFSDNSAATAAAIGKDSSGNGNNWTPNNISVTAGVTYDSMLDTPTPYADGGNGRGNYCVLNPLDWQTTSFTLTNANLTWTSTTTAIGSSRGTVGMTTGKWYWEVTATSVGSGSAGVGIAKDGSAVFGSGQALYTSNSGNKYIDGTTTAYGATWATNNVIGVAYDADAGELTFYKDNTSQGAITLSGYAGVNVCPVVSDASSLAFTLNANFGQRPFAYTPPTGFKALNTQNLPDATIKKGNQYFDATTWTGNGSSQNIINSGGFQPDLVWAKDRGSASIHILADAVRGTLKHLSSNDASAEAADDAVTAFNSNGFGSGTWINTNTKPFVAWQWKESASAGFDIVTYSGTGASQNINHSLGVAPAMMIIKRRNGNGDWAVYHKSYGPSGGSQLDLTTAFSLIPAYFGGVYPTSTVFTVNTANDVNASGGTYVAYLFAEVAGYSKFGSYTGNGSADGPFVYCGFRPKFVMVKCSSTGGAGFSWFMLDSARNTYNLMDNYLLAQASDAEAVTGVVDFLSNGFKLRFGGGGINPSSQTMIYAAFAENPFKNSLAR